MLIEHCDHRPLVHPEADVAASAVLRGDVTIGPGSCILDGAVLTAEGGPITIGEHCIVMEHAVIRASKPYPVVIGDHVLIGPHAHLTGCTVEDEVFIATGASIFNGAILERASVVRINGIVHIRSRLAAGEQMPIGWVAVGDPARLNPPDRWDEIGPALTDLDFAATVFGLEKSDRGSMMQALTRRYSRALARRADDRLVDTPTEDSNDE